jgi:DNA-binding MarR family transcriptional regulator
MTESESPTTEVCSCSALRQAARHVTRLYDQGLRPVGLGLNQYSMLAKLDRFGAQTINDLAVLLIMDRSTVGRLLRPLEGRGLVGIEVSPLDRRSRLVTLTAAGRAVMREAKPLWAATECRFQRAFGAAAAHDLRAVLGRVTTTRFDPA